MRNRNDDRPRRPRRGRGDEQQQQRFEDDRWSPEGDYGMRGHEGDEERVGHPQTGYGSHGGGYTPTYEDRGSRGMAGYGGGSGFGGMGYSMGVGGHGNYVPGRRSTGAGYGPGGEAYGEHHRGGPDDGRFGPEFEPSYSQPQRTRDWAPYRSQPDWPRGQHMQGRGEGPGMQEHDRDMSRSYGERGGIPRWSSQGEQSFRGRGPRDYKRSDDRIREDVCDQLTEDHEVDASNITIRVEKGEVTLEGTVDDRRVKWMAEEIASRCSGVVDVHNRLRVDRGEPRAELAGGQEQQPRNGGQLGQKSQTAQTGQGAQSRTDRS
jgi:hypothetical protein